MARSYFDQFVGFHQLWVTDGRKVLHAVASFGQGAIQNLTTIGSRVFFSVQSAGNGVELWTSDGTTAGTVMIRDINPGQGDSNPQFLTNVNGVLYFEADDGAQGGELWKSDGTAAGTLLVKDIAPDDSDSFGQQLTNADGTLFFTAADRSFGVGDHGDELWKTDGTAAGTVIVKDISPVHSAPPPFDLTNVSGTLTSKAATRSTARSYGSRMGRPPEAGWLRISFPAKAAPPPPI
jgi:ELWxxDGT repeat protein